VRRHSSRRSGVTRPVPAAQRTDGRRPKLVRRHDDGLVRRPLHQPLARTLDTSVHLTERSEVATTPTKGDHGRPASPPPRTRPRPATSVLSLGCTPARVRQSLDEPVHRRLLLASLLEPTVRQRLARVVQPQQPPRLALIEHSQVRDVPLEVTRVAMRHQLQRPVDRVSRSASPHLRPPRVGGDAGVVSPLPGPHPPLRPTAVLCGVHRHHLVAPKQLHLRASDQVADARVHADKATIVEITGHSRGETIPMDSSSINSNARPIFQELPSGSAAGTDEPGTHMKPHPVR